MNNLSSQPPCILIVDDEPVNINILSELLKTDYRTIAAKGGEVALKRLAAGLRPDLILLDVVMPDLNGHEVCKRIKADPHLQDILIIFITTASKAEDEAQGLELGAVDYISKPISPAVVLARVRSHLALQHAQRDMQRQRDFIRQVFGRYMGETMVDLVLASPKGLQLGGEKRKVSVLMCDLRNFTVISESISPEQVVRMLNSFFSEMVAVVEGYDGTVDNFMGDSMLVVFGSPLACHDDAHRAVACALAMQQVMPAINLRHEIEGLPQLAMGIGVNTGEAILGNIGSNQHMKYSVVGSTVNLAARLQAMAIGGQVLISTSTFSELRQKITLNGQLRVQVKGFGQPFEVYDVAAFKENASDK